jgi:xanthine dehydrogenase accessory factor
MSKTAIRSDSVEIRSAFLSDRPLEIMQFLYDSMTEGYRCALVMLTDIIGGASRPLGALMAVREDGLYCGFVSGGCVEAAVAHDALLAIAQQKDRVCRFGKGSGYFDLVLPCGGGIGLTVHVLNTVAPIRAFLQAKANRKPVHLAYDAGAKTLSVKDTLLPTGWQAEVFVSSHRPEPQIMLSGNSIESHLLAAMATTAGLDIVQADLQASAKLAIDSETAVVLLHHDIDRELPVLRRALATQAFFIGCLGSRKTHALRIDILLQEGHSPQQLERIQAPIGLFGPAREARSIAVSVLAQVLSIIESRRQ